MDSDQRTGALLQEQVRRTPKGVAFEQRPEGLLQRCAWPVCGQAGVSVAGAEMDREISSRGQVLRALVSRSEASRFVLGGSGGQCVGNGVGGRGGPREPRKDASALLRQGVMGAWTRAMGGGCGVHRSGRFGDGFMGGI